ncbi:MAG: PilZ domain-containing protein [Bdellovibrionaceae bacterium]|jgi:hypothetical protein|nr:PilZ domain-containing protein [Pseudobdellovibrionaceae bacterium]
MKNKPWPILILALIQFLMPAFNILLNSIIIDANPVMYTKIFITIKSWPQILEFFLLYPIVGVSIFLMKKWSYPVFLIATLWTFSMNSYLWFTGQIPPMPFWVFPMISLVNIAFVTYFLLPAVRKVYFDQRIRWWESKPRFSINLQATVTADDDLQVTVNDFSEGGAFIESSSNIDKGKKHVLKFTFDDTTIEVPFEIVHEKKTSNEKQGYGLKFNHTNETHNNAKKLTKQIKKSGAAVTRVPDPLFLSFKIWFSSLRGKEATK